LEGADWGVYRGRKKELAGALVNGEIGARLATFYG
jgi:hypothetical protein